MGMMDRVTVNSRPRPPIMLFYGVPGIGKTTLAASAPSPIFLQTEDGLGRIEAPTFGLLRSFDEIMQAIGELYSEPHDFKTVVLDSCDHAEPLLWAQACRDNGWKSIEDAPYGKGYVAALDHWRALLDGFRALRDERQMTVILLAHYSIQRFASPEVEAYDRYVPKMHKLAEPLVRESVEDVLFANYRVSTVKTEAGGFKKSQTRGVGGGERLLYTEERPAFIAKNRNAMPPSIPMEWEAVAEHIPFFNQNAA